MTPSDGSAPSGPLSSGNTSRDEPAKPPEAGTKEHREQQELRARERRRRRIDEVFGTVLPATTDDEREPGEPGGFSAEHYRANRPPHHVSR